MAFDTTALVTAIAEGRVDETEARSLLGEAQELEVKIAKLLTPPQEENKIVEPADVPAASYAQEQPQPEPVVEAQPEVQAEATPEAPVAPEAHAHVFVEGNTNCTVCGIDIATLQTTAPTGEVVQ